jgi:glycosyltransferase involved in cell wall biosynthesis
VVHRILSASEMPTLSVFADRSVRAGVRKGAGAILPGRYRWLWKAPTTSRVPRPLQWLFGCMNLASAVIVGVRAGRACRTENAGWVLSVVDSGISQIAGAIAARRAGLPHVLWVLDLWEENTYPNFDLLIARWLERRLWRGAAAILVHSEEAAEHYATKHCVQCQLLRTPIIDPGAVPVRTVEGSPAEIVCAGALYWAQADAISRLERATARIGSSVVLTVLGDHESLATPVPGAHRIERDVPESRFRDRLARADLLFLGLSFHTSYPEIIRTAAPARFPEYLAAGVPMVVHAPAGSHVVRRARELDLARVVDQPSDEALADAIKGVLDDPAAAGGQVARARACALEYDHRLVVGQLIETLTRLSIAASSDVPSGQARREPR